MAFKIDNAWHRPLFFGTATGYSLQWTPAVKGQPFPEVRSLGTVDNQHARAFVFESAGILRPAIGLPALTGVWFLDSKTYTELGEARFAAESHLPGALPPLELRDFMLANGGNPIIAGWHREPQYGDTIRRERLDRSWLRVRDTGGNSWIGEASADGETGWAQIALPAEASELKMVVAMDVSGDYRP